MSDAPSPNSKGRYPWRALFQHSTTPVFVLGKGRRLRFANAAWEKLTGVKLADALGMVCSARRHSTPLAAALAPTPEAQAGKPDTARRVAIGVRSGPPWWDVTFTPLSGADGVSGIVGFITVVGEAVPAAARKVPAGVAALRGKHAAHFTPDLFAGSSPATNRFAAQLRHAAESAVPVWLTGEPGSGKETAARVAHHAGPRRNAAFVALDCVGLQPYLIDSLLFGRGSLLSAEHAGTVYLKEPAALPRDMQQRFADFFTEPKPGAPRLICGSVRTAAEDAAGGMLVPEFHASLSVLELTVPPLRERLADLPRFASHFLPGTAIDPAAFQILAGQKWPGNLRELAAVLAEAAEAANRGTVKAEHLPREVRVRAGIDPPQPQPKPMTLDAILEAVEAKVIRLALARAGGNAAVAAEMLDIGRVRVLRQLKTKTIRKPKGQA